MNDALLFSLSIADMMTLRSLTYIVFHVMGIVVPPLSFLCYLSLSVYIAYSLRSASSTVLFAALTTKMDSHSCIVVYHHRSAPSMLYC